MTVVLLTIFSLSEIPCLLSPSPLLSVFSWACFSRMRYATKQGQLKGLLQCKRHKMASMEVCLDSYDLSTYPENSQIKLALTKYNYASDIMPYKTLYPKIYRIRQSVISNPKTLLHLPPLCPHFSELPLTPHLNVYQG